jgi:hypothetical protein
MNLPQSGAISVSYRFYVVGGMSLRWDLLDPYVGPSGTYRTCAEAGLTGMRINLQAEDGSFVYGNDGDPQSCTGAPVVYQFLKPGQYKVFIRGLNGSSVTYTNEAAPTVLTVRAFDQRVRSEPADTIIVRKK